MVRHIWKDNLVQAFFTSDFAFVVRGRRAGQDVVLLDHAAPGDEEEVVNNHICILVNWSCIESHLRQAEHQTDDLVQWRKWVNELPWSDIFKGGELHITKGLLDGDRRSLKLSEKLYSTAIFVFFGALTQALQCLASKHWLW